MLLGLGERLQPEPTKLSGVCVMFLPLRSRWGDRFVRLSLVPGWSGWPIRLQKLA